MNYREEEIRLLAQHDPFVKAAVANYDCGQCSWEQAMTLAVFALSQANSELMKVAMHTALTSPVAPFDARQAEPRWDRRPKPIVIDDMKSSFLSTEESQRRYDDIEYDQ